MAKTSTDALLENNSVKDVEKAAMLIRVHGHATTETLQATAWNEFLNSL